MKGPNFQIHLGKKTTLCQCHPEERAGAQPWQTPAFLPTPSTHNASSKKGPGREPAWRWTGQLARRTSGAGRGHSGLSHALLFALQVITQGSGAAGHQRPLPPPSPPPSRSDPETNPPNKTSTERSESGCKRNHHAVPRHYLPNFKKQKYYPKGRNFIKIHG